MDGAEATVEAREASMQLQLDGGSVAVTAEDASIGLTGPQQELVCRGAGYGLGFGYVANFGSPRGLDGVRLEYAVTTACGWPTCTSSSAAPGSHPRLQPRGGGARGEVARLGCRRALPGSQRDRSQSRPLRGAAQPASAPVRLTDMRRQRSGRR
jgi:hypothetical protein